MKEYKRVEEGELIEDGVRMIDGKPQRFVVGCEPVWNPEWIFNAIALGYDPDELSSSDLYRLNAKRELCRMYLQETDGFRCILVTDGDPQEGHWWQDNCEDEPYLGVDINDGSLEEVAERIREAIEARYCAYGTFRAMTDFMTDERFNPAWDRVKSIDDGEALESCVVGEDLPHRHIEI